MMDKLLFSFDSSVLRVLGEAWADHKDRPPLRCCPHLGQGWRWVSFWDAQGLPGHQGSGGVRVRACQSSQALLLAFGSPQSRPCNEDVDACVRE